MNPNKELTERLGLCWHEWTHKEGNLPNNGYWECKCEATIPDCVFPPDNIDFTSDDGKVQLLRLMYDKGEWYSVFALEDLMIDTTGKLRDACLEWLRRNK